MPRTRSLAFAELKLGILAVVAIVLAGVLIFAVGGGGFFWQQYPLKTTFPNVAGVKSGSPVRVAGIEKGSVAKVEFAGTGVEGNEQAGLLGKLGYQQHGPQLTRLRMGGHRGETGDGVAVESLEDGVVLVAPTTQLNRGAIGLREREDLTVKACRHEPLQCDGHPLTVSSSCRRCRI